MDSEDRMGMMERLSDSPAGTGPEGQYFQLIY